MKKDDYVVMEWIDENGDSDEQRKCCKILWTVHQR